VSLKLAIIGLGKIARDSHVPAIRKGCGFELAATVDPSGLKLAGVPAFRTCDELLKEFSSQLSAVALCTPPSARFALAKKCINHRIHVLLEKPPAGTVGEAAALLQLAREKDVTVFAAWHHRYNPAVALAQDHLRNRVPLGFEVRWVEDWRLWHPGQSWVWEPAGLGVFDAGMNAISLLTSLRDKRLLVASAELIYPPQKKAPVRARLALNYEDGCRGTAFFDWSGAEPETRTIDFEIEDGAPLSLKHSARDLLIGAELYEGPQNREYELAYEHFFDLIRRGAPDLDAEPLRVTADAFLIGGHALGDMK
jgi:D-galactose 1-dehydrogenase